MSTQYKSPSEVPTDVLLNRVDELISFITAKSCNGSLSREYTLLNEFTMRIPAECDRDADIVLTELVRRMRTLMSSPAVEAEPVAKPYCWIYETPCGYVRYWSRDFEKAAKFAAENNVELQPLYTAPPADVLRDAERYRWLRTALAETKSHWFCSIQRGNPSELDAAIDEEMGK